MSKLYNILRTVYLSRFNLLYQFHLAYETVANESYYPEYTRKSLIHRFIDVFSWNIKYNDNLWYYNLYGLDIRGFRNMNEYLPNHNNFIKDRARTNLMGSPISQIVILRDKFLFYKYLSSMNLSTPEVFAFMLDGMLYDSQMNIVDNGFLMNECNYFIKEADGQCASFVKKIRDYQEFILNKEKIAKGRYIFQRAIIQNDKISDLNSQSINTLRMVTVSTGDTITVFSTVLRVGTSKTSNVDNWAAGGLSIGVGTDGHLKEFGYYKPGKGTKTRKHPDTDILFKDFEVPFYKEAVELATRAHRSLYNIKSIGWDIAITPDGPTFVEGNDNWEIALMQASDGGLKKKWSDLLTSEVYKLRFNT